jgi:hypothetical protein
MPFYQRFYSVAASVIEFEPYHNFIGDFNVEFSVTVKVADTVFTNGECLRLSDIVQKCRPTQNRLSRSICNSLKRMLPDIINMMRALLIETAQRLYFRYNNCCNLSVFTQIVYCIPAAEQFCEFNIYSLKKIFM